MAEIMLNLSAWIERRSDNLKPYADHIIHSVKAYEAEIERLRRPEAAQVRVEDLDERMKAAGMIPLSELLENHGPMEKFKQHAAVKTFDDFVWWIKSQQKQFMTMRMQYELGDKDKSDDLFEWVFAHAAVYDQIATQLRALEPDTVTDQLSRSIADFVSRQEPLGAEFVQVLADNIEELYDTDGDGSIFNQPQIGTLEFLHPDVPEPGTALPPAPEKEG